MKENSRQLQRTDTLYMLINQRFDVIMQLMDIQKKNGASSKLMNPVVEKGKIVHSDIISLTGRMKNDEYSAINLKHELNDRSYRFTFIQLQVCNILCYYFVSVFYILK
jgi:hypothetical protein